MSLSIQMVSIDESWSLRYWNDVPDALVYRIESQQTIHESYTDLYTFILLYDMVSNRRTSEDYPINLTNISVERDPEGIRLTIGGDSFVTSYGELEKELETLLYEAFKTYDERATAAEREKSFQRFSADPPLTPLPEIYDDIMRK